MELQKKLAAWLPGAKSLEGLAYLFRMKISAAPETQPQFLKLLQSKEQGQRALASLALRKAKVLHREILPKLRHLARDAGGSTQFSAECLQRRFSVSSRVSKIRPEALLRMHLSFDEFCRSDACGLRALGNSGAAPLTHPDESG